jgi:2,3-bisphosphoglycerate-dependent phosphoglycerate mutase
MNKPLLTDTGLMKRREPRFVWILRAFSLLGLALSGLPNLDHSAWGQPIGVLRIYLARHGQTDWNFERRLQGSSDIALNSTGLKQAANLAERLNGVKLDTVYSSTLRRSRDTSEMVRGQTPSQSLEGLNARSLGKFEGKWLDRTKDPVTVQEYPKRSRDPNDELDGGESWNQFNTRVRAALANIRSQHSSGVILIVAHAGTNQMILREIFDLNLGQALSIKQRNDELYLIELNTENPPRLWKLIADGQFAANSDWTEIKFAVTPPTAW